MSCDKDMLELQYLDPDRVVQYDRRTPIHNSDANNDTTKVEIITGMLTLDGSKYHKYCDFNTFTKESFDVPTESDGWIKRDKNEIWIKDICDLSRKLFVPATQKISTKYPGHEMWKTLDNGCTSFLVFIKDLDVFVHGRPEGYVTSNKSSTDTDIEYIMTKLIKHYTPLQIFIGKSELNEMTEFSGGHGSKWDGNSILLRVAEESGKHTYVLIGDSVTEFETDEPIIEFVSSVGNNCVPYPYAVSKSYVYSLWDFLKSNVAAHTDRLKVGFIDSKDGVKADPIVNRTVADQNCDVFGSAMPSNIDREIITQPKNVAIIGRSMSDIELLNKKDICTIF